MSLDTRMQSIWYSNSRVAWLLLPLSGLFAIITALRRWLHRIGWIKIIKVGKPVIVVGNISVGGTGKTPLVIWLANQLLEQGFRIAVITRGYGGASKQWPQVVTTNSDASIVGDEPVMIAQQTSAMVIAGPDRVADAQYAIELGADMIISDDGLQHYRLYRDCEIAVIDGSRRLGNGYLLPAGPLRELSSRLQEVNLLLINQRPGSTLHTSVLDNSLSYRVDVNELRSLKNNARRTLESLRGQQVHVVTGIGNPQAFIAALQASGIKVLSRILPDHAAFKQDDLRFGDALPVLMTAKDAVKCHKLDTGGNCWVVDAAAVLDDITATNVINRIRALTQAHH